MATLSELQNALVAADKAGATDDARALAQAIISLKGGGDPSRAPVSGPKSAPFEDPGFGKSTLIAAGKTFDRLLDGATQMYLGARGENSALGGLKKNVDEKDAIYKPLQEARPFATGLGESLPSMVIPGGGAATWTGNALRMGAAGAIPAALEYGSTSDRLQKGAIAGAAGAVMPLLGATLKSAKTFAEPLYAGGRDAIVGRTLNRVAGDDAAKVISNLRGAGPLVPGSMPTAAQVAENGGIAAMERSAAQANAAAFSQRSMEQASARLSALRGIAGDDAAIAAAKSARGVTTKPMYSTATNAVYELDPSMQMMMQTPVMKKAIARAKELAANNERDFIFDTVTHSPFSGVGGAAPVVKKQITGQALQDIKTAIDDLIKDPTLGISGSEAVAADRIRGKMLGWMEGQNPEFKNARTTFAQMSQPINQMQVGQALVDKLKPALSDYGEIGKETAANFAGQLRNSENLMRNATGFKGIGSLESVMGPQNMATLNNIGRDLARKSNAETLGKGVGSDTFQKLAMQNIAEQSGMPRLIGGLLDTPGLSRATKWVYRDTDEMAQKVIAEAMINPQKAAQLMERARIGDLPPTLKKQLFIQAGLRGGGLLAGAAIAQP